MKCKTMTVAEGKWAFIEQFPNFSKTGSITGMKERCYGKDALLVKCGNWIYRVTQKVYDQAH